LVELVRFSWFSKDLHIKENTSLGRLLKIKKTGTPLNEREKKATKPSQLLGHPNKSSHINS